MAWYFISAGIILIIVSLYGKITFYRDIQSYESIEENLKSMNSPLSQESEVEQPEKRMNRHNYAREYNSQEDLNQKLEEVMSVVNSTREEILTNIKKTETPDISDNFKQLLQKKYEKNNKKDDQDLPENYKKVFQLAADGKNKKEIASSLNMGIRETELILKLYEKKEIENNNKGKIHHVT